MLLASDRNAEAEREATVVIDAALRGGEPTEEGVRAITPGLTQGSARGSRSPNVSWMNVSEEFPINAASGRSPFGETCSRGLQPINEDRQKVRKPISNIRPPAS